MNKKALKICLTCFASFLILIFVFGSREPVRLGTGHDKIMIGSCLVSYFVMRVVHFEVIFVGV